jgi:hypothetical protein
MIMKMSYTRSRWVSICLVAMLVGACTDAAGSPSSEFCSEVVPLLEDESIGDSVDKLLGQTRAVEEAAQSLDGEPRSRVLDATAPLVEQLLLAQEGRAGSEGWSSVPVVSEVEELCDATGLVSWVVQP